MTHYFIHLDEKGSFPQPEDRIYYMKTNDILTLHLDSRLHKSFRPILLTSMPKENGKLPKYYPIENLTTVGLKDLDYYFRRFDGFFNAEGSW
jgi:hypothetical protein